MPEFEIGNKYAQEWTLENAQPRFEDVLKYATENEDCLCMQDAIYQSGIPSVSFYQLVNTHTVLKSLKQDINDAIIRRVNKGALKDNFVASPAIWRMKQLGEREEQHIIQTGTTKTELIVSSKETIKEIEKLKKKFETE